jgi:hypothetical protein
MMVQQVGRAGGGGLLGGGGGGHREVAGRWGDAGRRAVRVEANNSRWMWHIFLGKIGKMNAFSSK